MNDPFIGMEDFGVNTAILHGCANSGQTSIKFLDLAFGVGTTSIGRF